MKGCVPFLAALVLSAEACSSNPIAPSVQLAPTVYEYGTPGVSLPSLVKEAKAQYPPEALANRIQGSVGLAVVVLSDGTVGEVTVVRSVDTMYGLDAEAVRTVKQFFFTPGTKGGVAVAVRARVDIVFALI